jgi:hypothetical protein
MGKSAAYINSAADLENRIREFFGDQTCKLV